MRHGETSGEIDLDIWVGDDPALALVDADIHAWYEAHDSQCECEGRCECDEDS